MNNVLVVEAPLFIDDKEGGSVYHVEGLSNRII